MQQRAHIRVVIVYDIVSRPVQRILTSFLLCVFSSSVMRSQSGIRKMPGPNSKRGTLWIRLEPADPRNHETADRHHLCVDGGAGCQQSDYGLEQAQGGA